MEFIDKKRGCIVKFNDDEDTKQKVFDCLIKWYKKHGAYCGETIQQCDEPIIDSPNVLSKIADEIIKFNVEDFKE